MSTRIYVTIKFGDQGGTLTFKTKTRAHGTKKEIEKSLRKDFENGLLDSICKNTSETFGYDIVEN